MRVSCLPTCNPFRRARTASTRPSPPTSARPTPARDSILALFPDLADDLELYFAALKAVAPRLDPLREALRDGDAVPDPRGRTPSTDLPYLGPTRPYPAEPGVVTSSHPLPTIPGYEILGVLDAGGMGIVYKARHISLDRLVAVKMIRSGRFAGEQARARFRTEAQALARLDQHPHIVRVFDSGEHDGAPYLAMEFVDGGSLKDAADGKPWPARKTAALVALLADAVEHAHRHNILHRDLKPANVLLTSAGVPKVSDFGLARRLDAGGLTLSGDVLGTPAFMPPEQAAGRPEDVGPASDVYGLGGILYFLLTGHVPNRPPDSDAPHASRQRPPLIPPRAINPRLPKALEQICLKALAAGRNERHATAAALANDLRYFLVRPRRILLAGAVAACFLLVGLVVGGLSLMRSPSPSVDPTPVSGFIDVRVWEGKDVQGPRNPHRKGLYLHQLDALPTKVGDQVQVEIKLNKQLFVYVVWINSAGQVTPCYPWQEFSWDKRPAENAAAELKLPLGAIDDGWEMEKGIPGMETLLLLTRETPLPADGEKELRAVLVELGPQPLQDGRTEAAVWFENGTVVTAETGRGPKSFDATRIDDPLLRTQRLLRERLGQHFPYTRAVCFAFRGQ